MSVHALYFSLDVIAVFSLLLFGAQVLRSAPRQLNAWLIALIAFDSVCAVLLGRQELAYWIPEAFRVEVGALSLPFHVARNLTPGLLMLLSYSLFQDREKFPRWLLAGLAIQILLEIIGFSGPGNRASQFDALRSIPALFQLVFVGLAIHWLVSGWESDLVEARRRLRRILLVVVGIFVFVAVLLERVIIPWDSVAMFYSHTLDSLLNIGVVIAAIHSTLRTTEPTFVDPFVPEPALESRGGTDQSFRDDAGVERVMKSLREERVYRDGSLTIASFAAKLSIPEYRLRRLIHERLGFRNFNALLHEYRIAEACQELSDPTKDHLPILTIALTVGYNSINPFNRAFREAKGMTPSAFRALAQKNGSPKTEN